MSDSIRTTKKRIIFSNKAPIGGEGIVIHYEHDPISVEGWATCDLRKTVTENEDDWLSQIESWHRGVSDKAGLLTPWWWFIRAHA